jgi:aryl-alcohol dehydrogenase-like predicted oxidoreductase
MEYTTVGRTGLDVSRVCMGCMSFGAPAAGSQNWSLDEATSRLFLKRGLELGITFFDTANAYSDGTSEEIVGRALGEMANRDEIVLATKLWFPMRSGRNAGGLSRKTIITEVEHSLRRLGTDYIDLYQIHRWDPLTPIEETLSALDHLVNSGKVRYIGASSMWAWQFSKALYTSELESLSKFVSMQNHYNLLNREEEREMMPLCLDQGIGVIPWSPLARGRLIRDWDEQTARGTVDKNVSTLYGVDGDREIVAAVASVAEKRGVSRAQVALAWMLSKPFITAPIVGSTKLAHIDDAAAAVGLELGEDEIALLEAPYTPRPVVGFE